MRVSREKKSRDPLSRAATILKERSMATWLTGGAPATGPSPTRDRAQARLCRETGGPAASREAQVLG